MPSVLLAMKFKVCNDWAFTFVKASDERLGKLLSQHSCKSKLSSHWRKDSKTRHNEEGRLWAPSPGAKCRRGDNVDVFFLV